MENKKIKVGMFMDSYLSSANNFNRIDGVSMVMHNYAKVLEEKEMAEVTMAVPNKKADDSGFSYRVVRCRDMKIRKDNYKCPLPMFDPKFKKTLKKIDFDVIHLHSPFMVGKAGLKIAKKNNIPVVATFHTQFKRDFYKVTRSKIISWFLVKRIMKVFNKCDEVFAMNKTTESVLREYGYKGKSRIIPNATDMNYPENAAEIKQKVNKKYGLKEDDKVLLFISRIAEVKNIFLMVESLLEVKKEFPNFKMIIGGDGTELEALKKRVEKLGLDENVIFTGFIADRDELASLYLRGDLFLFPSLYDTDSLVQKEAGANKTPSVFIKGSVTALDIVDNRNGFLAEKNTAKCFGEKVIEVMKNEKLLKEVSENVYNDLFRSWEEVVDDAHKAYSEVIENYKNKQKEVSNKKCLFKRKKKADKK